MKISQIVPSLEAQHGGPSVSVYQLALAMSSTEHEVELLTTDPSPSPPTTDGKLTVRPFQRSFPQWLSRSAPLARYLRTNECDVVHQHSLWLRTLHYAAQRNKRPPFPPLVIAPRGMMSSWAWGNNRRKKQFAQERIHPQAMETAAGWHATSSEEADDIRRLGFTQPICLSPNGVSSPTSASVVAAELFWRRACPEVASQRVALFYSRFHRKKRLLELIDLWLVQAPADWLLLVVGIPEEYSVSNIKSYVMRQSGGGRVQVFSGVNAPPPYAVASLFLLPSHTENFGLVIAEAMAHGVPVVVTDVTPWAEVNRTECGWCVPWSDYAQTLTVALAEEPASLRQRGSVAKTWVAAEYSWVKSARLLIDFYHELINHRP